MLWQYTIIEIYTQLSFFVRNLLHAMYNFVNFVNSPPWGWRVGKKTQTQLGTGVLPYDASIYTSYA